MRNIRDNYNFVTHVTVILRPYRWNAFCVTITLTTMHSIHS